MKRTSILLLIPLAAALLSLAQHETPSPAQTTEQSAGAAHAGEGHEGAHEGPSIWWKWANFGLLAAGLGFLIGRSAPAFFASRTDEIRKGLEEAARMKEEAAAKVAEIERRMKGLEEEIASLRQNAKAEMEVEADRVRKETEQQVSKVQAMTQQDVAAAVKAARSELKAYSAELAVQLAEKKLRSQLDAPADARLTSDLMKRLG